MLQHSLAFDRPIYLTLAALIPLVAWLGYRSLAGLGRWRRAAALTLRSVVMLLIILALADMQVRRQNDELAVVYLLDQSLSIPAAQRQAMLNYVSASIEEHRDPARDDRFAVLAFGRDATVEVPLVSTSVRIPPRLETLLDPESTDLATAVQRAKAMLPADSARRIVLITDGNENVGNVFREAQAAASAGVSIDVVPVDLSPRGSVAVEKIDLPANVRRGQPFDVRVVLRHDAATEGKPVAGRFVLVRKAGGREVVVAEQAVTLDAEKQVLTIHEQLDDADFYAYEARFVADEAPADAITQDNTATAFTHVSGRGTVLLIENAETAGAFDHLVERLRRQDIEVETTSTERLFNSLAELQRYDAVVLANVSRSSTDDADGVASFSDEQIEMLERNTREMGCGLVMIGGEDSFGAGGWANTALEKAMPVDFQIKAAEVIPVGALSLVIDRSGSMTGEKLFMSRRAAIEAVKALGRRDFISVVAFDTEPNSIVPLRPVGDYRSAASRIERIGAGGGTDMFPGMQRGYADLRQAAASVKHMIVLTDGQTAGAEFEKLVREMRAKGITVSSVAVGGDANVPLLRSIANLGGGKFYAVKNARALPRIFMREVRRVTRSLVFEPPSPLTPQVVGGDHEILRGLAGGVPPIRGMVLTTVKENPLVEVLLRSPQPADAKYATLLAAWPYGAGKAVAFTSDAGRRWATAWPEWEGYDKFFSQVVRWAMRPAGDAGGFTVATNLRQGKAEVVVTAIDAADEYINNRAVAAMAVTPGLKSLPISLEQTAPGRYVGEFDAAAPGSYLIVVNPGGGQALIRTGVNVGYSAEYGDRHTNRPLLESLAKLPAGRGAPGVLASGGLDSLVNGGAIAPNPFRRDLPPAVSTRSVWPWLVVAASCLFWGDVFVRCVQINFDWLAVAASRAWDALLRRQPPVETPATMDRLRSRKREVGNEIAARGSVTSAGIGETSTSAGDAAPTAAPALAPMTSPRPALPSNEAFDVPAVESYTERLLRAKQRLRDGQDDATPRG